MDKTKHTTIKLPKLDKFLIIIAPVALVILLIVSYAGISQYKEQQVKYKYDSLYESANNKALYLSDQLKFNLNLVRALTTFPEVYTMDREAQAQFFASRAAILSYGQFFVVDSNGISYYFTDGVEKDQSKEPFFQNIMNNETYITDPFYTEYGPIMTLCAAIRNNSGSRVGTLCATFNLSEIQEVIKETVSSLQTHTFVINSEGKYVAVDSIGDINDQNSLYENPNNDISLISKTFDSKYYSTGKIILNGVEYYSAVVYMNSTSWCLVECTETSTVLSHIHVIELIEVLFTLLIALLLFVIYHIIKSWRESFRKLHTDPLCGCGSRAACLAQLNSLEKSKEGKAFILYMDLNKFKYVNDTFGHERGDEVLIIFADVLMQYLCPLGFVGRIGGDEFVGIFKNVSKEKIDGAIKSIERELDIRSTKLKFDYAIEASFGYSEYVKGAGKSANDVLRAADSLMYEDKVRREEQN